MNFVSNDSEWIDKYGDVFKFSEDFLLDDTGSFKDLANIYNLTEDEFKNHQYIKIKGKKSFIKAGLPIKILKIGNYGFLVAVCQTALSKNPIKFEVISLVHDKYPIKVDVN